MDALTGIVADTNEQGFYVLETEADSYTFRDPVLRDDMTGLLDLKVAVDPQDGRILGILSFDRCPTCGSKAVQTNGHMLVEPTDGICDDCGHYWTSDF